MNGRISCQQIEFEGVGWFRVVRDPLASPCKHCTKRSDSINGNCSIGSILYAVL
jgi:hypothetical protein